MPLFSVLVLDFTFLWPVFGLLQPSLSYRHERLGFRGKLRCLLSFGFAHCQLLSGSMMLNKPLPGKSSQPDEETEPPNCPTRRVHPEHANQAQGTCADAPRSLGLCTVRSYRWKQLGFVFATSLMVTCVSIAGNGLRH